MVMSYIPTMLHAPDAPMFLHNVPQLESQFNYQMLAKAEIGSVILVGTAVVCTRYRRPFGYSRGTVYAVAAAMLGALYVWPSKLPVGAGGEEAGTSM